MTKKFPGMGSLSKKLVGDKQLKMVDNAKSYNDLMQAVQEDCAAGNVNVSPGEMLNTLKRPPEDQTIHR